MAPSSAKLSSRRAKLAAHAHSHPTNRFLKHSTQQTFPGAYISSWNGRIEVTRPAGYGGGRKQVTKTFSDLYLPRNNYIGKELIFWFAHAIVAIAINGSYATINCNKNALRTFTSFIVRSLKHLLLTPYNIDNLLLERYQRTLRESDLAAGTVRTIYGRLLRMLRLIRLYKPTIIRSDLLLRAIPQRTKRAGTSQHSRRAKNTVELTFNDGARLEAHLFAQVNEYYSRWRHGQDLMKNALAAGCNPAESSINASSTLGEILLKFRHLYFKSGACITTYRLYYDIQYAIYGRSRAARARGQRSGFSGPRNPRLPVIPVKSFSELRGMVAPHFDDLFPFLALVAARTFANTSGLCTFPLNCFDPPSNAAKSNNATVLDAVLRTPPPEQSPGRDHVWWEKNRPTPKWKHRSFFAGDEKLPPAIIRKVQEITAYSREFADRDSAKFLFVACLKRKKGRHRATHLDSVRIYESLTFFRCQNPHLPRFTFHSLRLRGQEASYAATGGNIFAGKATLGHESPNTTYKNYMGRQGRRINEATIARFTYYFQQLFQFTRLPGEMTIDGAIAKTVPPTPPIPAWTSPLAESARQIAQAFSDSGLVFHGEAERCARLLQFTTHLAAEQKPHNIVRWEATVGPIYRFLSTDVLNRFGPAILEEAKAIVPLFPPLPPLE